MFGSLCVGVFFAGFAVSSRSISFPGVEGGVASGIDFADFFAFFALFAGDFFAVVLSPPCSSVWCTGESDSALSLVLLAVAGGGFCLPRPSGSATPSLSWVVASAPFVSLPNWPWDWARASISMSAKCMVLLRRGGWPLFGEPADVRSARQRASAWLERVQRRFLDGLDDGGGTYRCGPDRSGDTAASGIPGAGT